LTNSQSAYGWGSNFNGQLGNGLDNEVHSTPIAINNGILSGKYILKIDGGLQHSVVLDTGNVLYSFGSGNLGQLGAGSSTYSNTPINVDMTGVLNGKTITDVRCGSNFNVVLAADGTLHSWGTNDKGQLGAGLVASTASSTAVAVVASSGPLKNKIVSTIRTGGDHACALTTSGDIACWGCKFYFTV
jgi:alpha-tubulin suppressor-like RCC1 family protein